MPISPIEIDSDTYLKTARLMRTKAPDMVGEAVDLTILASFEDVQGEGEPDVIVELIDLYLNDTSSRMAAMQTAITRNDEVPLRHGAHSVRGSSANLGAHRVAALCEELERMECNELFQRGSGLLTRLEQELEHVRQVFTAERQKRLSGDSI
jgi:two-component system sensor histidine kinase/response regulator